MKEVLTIRGLCIGLRQRGGAIVKNIYFTLHESSALAIVGESGCGKTILCKSIMRVLNPHIFTVSGSIRYKGTELLGPAANEKTIRRLWGNSIALIVQNPMTAFDPSLKIGAQIIETIQAHQKISKHDAYRAGISALEKMNLPHSEQLMNRYPHTLSGGMLQRIMIALAMFHKPDIIIADEATTALDVINQNIILDELEKMKKNGVALLLVTHDFGVAAKIADEVIVMREGAIIERASVYDMFAAPRESYTKELVEAAILNREEAH